MKCPKCKTSDSEDAPHVFRNLGGKRRHPKSNTRRYECTSCGHRFVSVETYLRDIASKVNPPAGPAPMEATS
jgi:transcriptional regulator NrdR family protein